MEDGRPRRVGTARRSELQQKYAALLLYPRGKFMPNPHILNMQMRKKLQISDLACNLSRAEPLSAQEKFDKNALPLAHDITAEHTMRIESNRNMQT
jgi:hypothetical protein